MNSIYESLIARKSVRVFEDKPIEAPLKAHILEAAFQAPTAGAQMLYSIIDVTDQVLKDQLAKTCDNQPFIAQAPMVLVFLADCRRWFDTYRYAGLNPRLPGVGDLFLAIQDAVIAAQNAVVAAESFGVGSCYIGDILENAEIHRKLLKLDPYVVPISMLVFGYPTEQQVERQKPARFDAKYMVHENHYRRLSEPEHRNMFIERAQNPGFDFDAYIEKFCNRKYMSDFSLEMSRSSRLYVEEFMVEIRRAQPEESGILTDLAYRSESHWGHDSDLMEAFRTSYAVTPAYIKKEPVHVLERAGKILGFYGLLTSDATSSLEYLFIDPDSFGKGYGRLLWHHALKCFEENGIQEFSIVTSPEAKDFYLKLGALYVMEVESLLQKGRLIPQLIYRLDHFHNA